VGPGAADRSYGIQVARLAGLPPGVVARARDVLAKLEAGDRTPNVARLIEDLPLFAARAATPPPAPHPVEDPNAPLLARLRALDPDAMTPREALDALYKLKGELKA
jgi:DNA mismatch repair protein MutS